MIALMVTTAAITMLTAAAAVPGHITTEMGATGMVTAIEANVTAGAIVTAMASAEISRDNARRRREPL